MAQATKSFKIGEQAVGGIIRVEIKGKVILIKALDYNTKEVVKQGTITTEQQGVESQITAFLEDLTSYYYAQKIMDWIKNKADLKPAWY
jgi:hypothetical protein